MRSEAHGFVAFQARVFIEIHEPPVITHSEESLAVASGYTIHV